jgi:hypothetical protein
MQQPALSWARHFPARQAARAGQESRARTSSGARRSKVMEPHTPRLSTRAVVTLTMDRPSPPVSESGGWSLVRLLFRAHAERGAGSGDQGVAVSRRRGYKRSARNESMP